jgi:hypothetical protein
LSLVDADLGKVITLQKVCTVSDAHILTTTGDLSTTEVLTLPPDDTLTTIVTCADRTTFDSFQSGEMLQTIEVTYDLTFPTSQTLTTVLSTSEPQLVFATPITMSLDQHQTVLTVSEIHSPDSLSGEVQLLETPAASKLPNAIFIEEERLEGLEEPMLLHGSEPASHIKIENFTALDKTVLQMTADSVLPEDVLTPSSLLRERLMSGPKPRPSTLPSLQLVPSHCDAVDGTIVSSISIPAGISDSVAQHDPGTSTLSVSSFVPGTSTDGSHLDPLLSIQNTVKPLYANITVGNIDPDCILDSFPAPNPIHLSCTDVSSNGTNAEPSVPQLSIPESVFSHHSDISREDSPPITDIHSVPNSGMGPILPSARTDSFSAISAFDDAMSGISAQSMDLIQPMCPNMSDKNDVPEIVSALAVDSSVQSSLPAISDVNGKLSVQTLSVDAVDVNMCRADIHPIEPHDVSMCVEDTHADLVLASLPISTEDIHPSSSVPIVVQSSCSDESANAMMPDFLPQTFPFLNVE